ncbi:MAG: hypothetical protein HY619_02435 [Thaumarchaeota archaeon]|nr:hypothetical protein [Nitrososphaerota archaeon]
MLSGRAALSKMPLNILVNPRVLKSQKPWEVDLTTLLETFLKILGETGPPDLRLAGSAALTSAILYRLKVETMFLFERLKPELSSEETEEPPQIIIMPFRYELRSTGLEELLKIFERVVEDILLQSQSVRPPSVISEAEPRLEMDFVYANIRNMLASFRAEVLAILRSSGDFFFADFVKGLTLIEKARRFVLLLFLAMDNIVGLEQVGEDIRVLRVTGAATV